VHLLPAFNRVNKSDRYFYHRPSEEVFCLMEFLLFTGKIDFILHKSYRQYDAKVCTVRLKQYKVIRVGSDQGEI